LRSRAEARVLALVPAHSLRDRFDAIDAAVVEAGESQPVLGPLLRLVAELYRQAAHHYCAACDLVDHGDVEFDRAAAVRGASANGGDEGRSGSVVEAAEAGGGEHSAAAVFQSEGAEHAALKDSSASTGAQSGGQSHKDDSAIEAAGNSGGGECAGVSTAPEQATGGESAREVTEEAQQLGFQDNPKRGFKVRWEDGGGTHRPSYQFSARASAGSSRYGSTRGTTRSPRSSDEGGWEDGDGVSGAEVTGVGDGGVPDAPGGGGDMDAASLLARRMSLVSDRFRGSSFGSGERRHVNPQQHHSGLGSQSQRRASASGATAVAAASAAAPATGAAAAGHGRPSSSGGPAQPADGIPHGSESGMRPSNASSCSSGRRATYERYSWGRTLTTDDWAPAPEGVAKLDLTDMEGKIREERQRRTAAFKAERARLAAGGQ
jgi:hypothetical protein